MVGDLHEFNLDLETNQGLLPKRARDGPGSISSGRLSIAGVEPQKNIF